MSNTGIIHNLDDAKDHFDRQVADADFVGYFRSYDAPQYRLGVMYYLQGRPLYLLFARRTFEHFDKVFKIKDAGKACSIPRWLAVRAMNENAKIAFVFADGKIGLANASAVCEYVDRHATIYRYNQRLPDGLTIKREEYCFPLALLSQVWPPNEQEIEEKPRPPGQASLDSFGA